TPAPCRSAIRSLCMLQSNKDYPRHLTTAHSGPVPIFKRLHGPDDLEPAFQALRTGRVEGVSVVASAMLNGLRRRIGELSRAAKIPAICQFRAGVEAGCLASYGITLAVLYS